MERTLYFGTAYAEPDQKLVERDLGWIREADMNLICFGASSWERWEPEEGVYDFTSFHCVLSGAQSRGLQVIVEDPTDRIPAWLRKKGGEPAPYRERFLEKLMEQCHAYGCIIGFGPGCASRADWTACGVYYASGAHATGAEISMQTDRARGLGEDRLLVCNTQSVGKQGQLPYPGQLRLAAYHQLAGGAGCVCYDGFHSDPLGRQKGILEHDLTRGRIYRECARLGAELSRVGERLAGMKKKNRIAIMTSRNSELYAKWPEQAGVGYRDCLQWVYDSFYRLNLEVDVIPDTQRDFTGYELLVTPCLYSAEDNLIWAIRDFVAGGGNLISTFRSFFADENGRVRQDAQPYGMTDVFGMFYQEYTVPAATDLPEYGAAAAEWMELLSLSGARSMGVYGGTEWPGVPAVTCHSFGRGAAAYIGCYSPEGLEPILLRLLSAWHIPVPEISWPVVIKRGVSPQGSPILYLLHYGGTPRVIPCPGAGRELLSGRLLEEGEPLALEPWDVKILEGIR